MENRLRSNVVKTEKSEQRYIAIVIAMYKKVVEGSKQYAREAACDAKRQESLSR